MDPLIGASLINVGGSALSGGFRSDNRAHHDRIFQADMYKMQRRDMRHDAAAARDFSKWQMGNDFRMRIQQAKEMGIHPLAALGAQMNVVSPMSPGGASGAGYGSNYSGDARRDAAQMAAMEIGRMVADREESQSRTELNRAQAAALTAELNLGSPGAPPVKLPAGLADHDIKKPQFTTNQRFFGMNLRHSPVFSDAQTREDMWGDSEIRELLLQLPQIVSDVIYSDVMGAAEGAARDYPSGYRSSDPVFSTFE